MIPWADFDNGSRNDVPTDIRMPLYEHWLGWVDIGPSTTAMFLESPMLEVAHERQFAITQQGGDSAEFEVEHTHRMETCLRQLGDYFQNHATDDRCCPSSPYATDLTYCWKPSVSVDSAPSFRLPSERCESVESPNGGSEPVTPTALTILTTKSSYSTTSLVTQTATEADSEEGEISDNTSDRLRISCLGRSRAASTVPTNAARAQKIPRQRRRYDSKLATDLLHVSKKRSAQWIVDKAEDEAIVAARRQAAPTLETSHLHVSSLHPSSIHLPDEPT